jgi:hypothetical protein
MRRGVREPIPGAPRRTVVKDIVVKDVVVKDVEEEVGLRN